MKLKQSSQNLGPRLLLGAGTLGLLSTLVGCGMAGSSSVGKTITPLAVATISGSVHGGQQPVSGATIQLYAAGAPATGSGYGVGASTLLTQTVTTDANGNFSITGLYTCPTPAVPVYLIASGGNPGVTGAATNSSFAEMAALGICPAGGTLVGSIPSIDITEVTTVAAVTALQQFMATPATANKLAPNVGAPSTAYASGTTKLGSVQSAVIGMNNAFTTAKVLADIGTGQSPNQNFPYATPEVAKINTIANILSACANSVDSAPGSAGPPVVPPTPSANCTSLFNAVTPSGKTAATDMIQAAFYIAQNPINNITNIYNLIPTTPPYMPYSSAPGTLNTAGTGPATGAFNDSTIAINYSPTVASVPSVGAAYGIAIDAYGNAWIANQGGIGGVSASAEELGTDGSALTVPATTYSASATNGSTAQFTPALTAASTRTFSAPKGVAIDLSNRAWVANFSDAYQATTTQTTGSVGVFGGSSSAGVNGASGGTGNTGYFVGSGPFGIAVDGSNNVAVDNSTSASTGVLDGSSIAQLTSAVGAGTDGTYTYSTSASTAAPNRTPGGGTALIAIDTNANVTGGIIWAANSNACKVQGQFNAATYYGAISQFSDGSLAPLAGSDVISALSNAAVGAGSTSNCGSTSTYVGQLITAGTANTTGIAIDRNNGVWVVDIRTSSLGYDGLTYIGAPAAATGIASSSVGLVNGVAPTLTAASTAGTTLSKAGAAIVDGNNNVWVSNQSTGSVVEAQLTGSTITLLTPGQGGSYGSAGAAYGLGFVHNTTTSLGIAVDPSGNVWVTNGIPGTVPTYTNNAGVAVNVPNSVTVIVGAAGPVITPLALAIKAGKLGSKP